MCIHTTSALNASEANLKAALAAEKERVMQHLGTSDLVHYLREAREAIANHPEKFKRLAGYLVEAYHSQDNITGWQMRFLAGAVMEMVLGRVCVDPDSRSTTYAFNAVVEAFGEVIDVRLFVGAVVMGTLSPDGSLPIRYQKPDGGGSCGDMIEEAIAEAKCLDVPEAEIKRFLSRLNADGLLEWLKYLFFGVTMGLEFSKATGQELIWRVACAPGFLTKSSILIAMKASVSTT